MSCSEEKFLSGHCHKVQIGEWSVTVMVDLLQVSPIPTHDVWSSVRVIIKFLVTSFTLLPLNSVGSSFDLMACFCSDVQF